MSVPTRTFGKALDNEPSDLQRPDLRTFTGVDTLVLTPSPITSPPSPLKATARSRPRIHGAESVDMKVHCGSR